MAPVGSADKYRGGYKYGPNCRHDGRRNKRGGGGRAVGAVRHGYWLKRSLLREGWGIVAHPSRAVKLAQVGTQGAVAAGRLVLRWPDSAEAHIAQYEYAKLLDDSRDDLEAFSEYSYLLDRYPEDAPTDDVLSRQLAIASQLVKKRKARVLFGGFSAADEAVPYLEEILKRGPRWERASEVQYLVGKSYEKTNVS